MPRTLARAFTASRSSLGILMLSCAAFGSNSNLTALPPDRSYCVRSAVSTKCCASSSVSKLGIFFFIVVYLLLVHVSSAHRPDIFLAVAFPDCENDEKGFAVSRPADGPMPFLGWGRIGQEDDGLCKQPLDLRTGNPVFRQCSQLPSSHSNPDMGASIIRYYTDVYTSDKHKNGVHL